MMFDPASFFTIIGIVLQPIFVLCTRQNIVVVKPFVHKSSHLPNIMTNSVSSYLAVVTCLHLCVNLTLLCDIVCFKNNLRNDV